MVSVKMYGFILAAFIAGAFIASPELRAYAASTVGSADIIDGSIQSIDIGNGQVKAADIATDAVGAAELQGVSKLKFSSCSFVFPDDNTGITAIDCSVTGARPGDHVIATLATSWTCGKNPVLLSAIVNTNDKVTLNLSFDTSCGTGSEVDTNVIVYR